jgi:hypothetical protein
MGNDEGDFVAIRCGQCGCLFGLSRFLYDKRREDKDTFYCSNGHPRAYAENEADRLRRERDRLQQRLAEKDDAIKYQRELREATERQLSATRGVVTRIKNRVGHGVCPCCNRTFENLSRHMASEHPTYAAEAAE